MKHLTPGCLICKNNKNGYIRSIIPEQLCLENYQTIIECEGFA
jgi:hypothetical protein